MKKRIKYYVCLLAILVTGTSLSRASSGSDMSITAASAIETLHAKSLHIAYATGVLAMPSSVYVHAATSPALSSEMLTGERDLLFAPPPFEPPGSGTGSGGAVGEAPIRDCVWLLVFISLAYMILASGFDKLSHRTIQLPLIFQPGRYVRTSPFGGRGTYLAVRKAAEARERSD